MRKLLLTFLVLGTLATPAFAADPAIGVWQTEPDRKNLTSHVEIRACGVSLCGKVLRAFDASGREVKTGNVGRELFWDMKPQGAGSYTGGTAQVPLVGKVNGSMKLAGNRLRLDGCKLGACAGQTWTRLR